MITRNSWSIVFCFSLVLLLSGCVVTLISGYDEVIDETATKMKKDFNLHFIKVVRTIQDDDPTNQAYENFQEYYDNLEVDLMMLKDRAAVLDEKKASQVIKQVHNIDSTFQKLITEHTKGFKSSKVDDHRDIKNGINSSINALIKLEEELKNTVEKR